MKNTLQFLFAAAMIFLASQLAAQDLVYKPKNPAFGGDTFNYNWLLSSAQVQDLTSDTRTKTTSSRNSVDAFASNLNNLLLSQISRQLISDQFGENGLQDGTYTLGNFQVDVATTLDGLTITIFDQAQGESTQIVIPFF
ncbi:MAG: curli assembly protein CsgF [Saprospiraceae bacterium]|nr:curli assembly protein CsgF [Saprospiraceae bacterium]